MPLSVSIDVFLRLRPRPILRSLLHFKPFASIIPARAILVVADIFPSTKPALLLGLPASIVIWGAFLSYPRAGLIVVLHSRVRITSGCYWHFGLTIRRRWFWKVIGFKYDSNHQAATRADCDIFAVSQVCNGDFKFVAARTWVMIYFEGGIISHILDLYFIVDIFGHFDVLQGR